MTQLFQSLGLKIDWAFTLTVAGLIMTRLVMITATIPFLTGKPVPGSIRLGTAAVLLLFLYPSLAPSDPSMISHAPLYLMLLFLKEAFYGISIGVAASIVFHAFQAAGDVIDSQRGAAQARLLIPQLGEQTSVFGSFSFLLGIVFFLSIDGHLFFLKAVFESYEALPLFAFPKANPDFLAMSEELIRMTGTVLLISLQLTAPVLIAIFIADLILAVISKAAPAINVWEMGFAVKGVLGVMIYFLSIGLVATQMGKLSMTAIDSVERIIKFLALSPSQDV